MKFKVGAEKPPLSKTDSPVPGEVARSARRGAGGRRRRPEGFRRAMPCTLSHPQTGRNPSASQARHLPLTREAFFLWGEGGGIARKVCCGRKRARRPEGWPPYVPLFRLDVGQGALTPPKLVAGRMLRNRQTVGADSISARGSIRGGNGRRCFLHLLHIKPTQHCN